jgi:membrane-bound ClpP family serine protease
MKIWEAHRLWAALIAVGALLTIAFSPGESFFSKLFWVCIIVGVVLFIIEYRRRGQKFK